MPAEFSSTARLFRVREGEVVSQVIDDEAIIINMTTGCYYSLDKTGAEIWNCIAQVASAADIVDLMESRYDCGAADVAASVGTLLAQLEAEQLIEPLAEEQSREPSEVAGDPVTPGDGGTPLVPFADPRFEKHSDMRDFLLVDPIHQVDDRGWPHKNED